MAADITDLITSPTTNDRPASATLTAIKASGATSLTCDSTTGWETTNAVHFTMYEVDANSAKLPDTQRDYKGIVNSATTINNLVIRGGADREFPIGAKVICAPTAAWADDLANGITTTLNPDGTLKDDIVTTAAIAAANVTTAKIADDAVTPAKWTNPYCFRVHTGSTTTLVDAVEKQITLDVEDYDYGSDFASSEYTAPVNGVYHFDGNFGLVGTVTSGVNGYASIAVNDVTISRGALLEPINFGGFHTSGDLELSAGDTVSLRGLQNSAGNEDTSTSSVSTWFSGHLVHAT